MGEETKKERENGLGKKIQNETGEKKMAREIRDMMGEEIRD